jgi:hypothetical protein
MGRKEKAPSECILKGLSYKASLLYANEDIDFSDLWA